MDEVEHEIYEKEKFIKSQLDQIKKLHESYNRQVEFKNALLCARDMINGTIDQPNNTSVIEM